MRPKPLSGCEDQKGSGKILEQFLSHDRDHYLVCHEYCPIVVSYFFIAVVHVLLPLCARIVLLLLLSIVSILFHGIVLVIDVQVLVLSDSIYWYLLYGI